MALTKNIRVEPGMPIECPMPRTIVEPSRLPPASLEESERDDIQRRVAKFKAHQERFAREREEFAAALLKSMLERS